MFVARRRMNRRALDCFTRDIWKRFDHRDLEPLKWAILRRRRVLAMQLWRRSSPDDRSER
jgi:hypothetical protein